MKPQRTTAPQALHALDALRVLHVLKFRLTRATRGLACLALLSLSAGSALAQVAVNQILFPVNVGRTLDATVTIDYTRTSAAAAVIQTVIPPQLGFNPPALPAGCVSTLVGGNPAIECTVPAGGAGAAGSLTFQVRGATLGSFSLVAVGTGGSTASNTGTVRSSGDLTLLKSKSPAGNLLPGQSTTFTLQPQVAAGADDLPAGSTFAVTDQLPGTVTDFSVSAIASGIASCTSVATANSAARTVTCTYTGPLTVAAINSATITITGAPGTTGTFNNTGSIAAGTPGYFDRDVNNNIANVPYAVDAGGDVQALGSFPAAAVSASSPQTLTLRWRNNGPTALPAGGTISTSIPAGFTVVSLPAGCSGPATGVVLGAPAVLSCTAAAAAGVTQDFAVPLLMPAAPAAGNFVATVAPPAGFGDSVPANNSVTLPWQVVNAFADLRGSKAKSPASGPVAPGTTVTTTLTVTNDAASTSTATYSALGGGTELRVVDYLKPTEIAGDALANVSAGWQCTVSNNADPSDATRSKRIECVRTAGGLLAPGADVSVSFGSTVAAVVGQVTLSDRMCAGETVLAQLGLTAAQGPQPPGSGQTANDCAVAGTSLIATDVTGGQAGVTVRTESSIDGITWVDPVGAAPTVLSAANSQFWRITITTPAGGAQTPIPTLILANTLPGILNVASPGAPAPAYVTPLIAVTTQVTAGAATGVCPNVAAGSSNLACTFTNVSPGTTVVVTYAVQRPFGAGTLTNTASVSSPDAILSGTTSDAAALIVAPRIDVAATTKTVTPNTPRVGQTLQFTITTQNLGPEDVTGVGEFKIVDDLNTNVAAATVAFADIVASGSELSCSVAGSALADEGALAAGHVRVRCTNTTPVARYATRTLTINARVLKPAAMAAAGTVYSNQSNTARVDIPDARCEFKTETSSNASVSAACNDAASTSNNVRSATFDVLVPQIDVQQRKTRVLPAGQTSFGAGQPLRYRFRLQNNGPSRAEGVTMTDQMTVPAGFTLASPQIFNVNGVAAEAGYALDTSKNASVSCTQAAPNANLICVLAPTATASFLDAGREVNFEVELAQTGSAVTPVSFGNEALVCADETASYETSGACARNVPNNNNVAAVNDVIFPRTDLALAKSTVTPSPVAIGQAVEYVVTVRNIGPSATQQLRVVDLLPPDFELVTTGPQAPSVTLGSFVTAAPSTATGATLTCLPAPATITAPGQQQTVSCVINATPGPLGAGALPASNDVNNNMQVRLFARPKLGIYAGPYASDRFNNAGVSPGLAADGTPLSIDTVPGNNGAASPVQVARSSLAGRVFIDRNGNGLQEGTTAAEDEGIGNVTLTLTGVDLFGNAITRTTTSNNAVGPTRGDYLFDHLPPGTYTVTETQPLGYANSPGTPLAASAGGSYAAAATVGTSAWAGAVVPLGTQAINYNFPEGPPAPGITGKVFVDRNDNGVRDATDTAIAGVTLGLYPAGTTCPALPPLPGGAMQTVQTDASGQYTFAGLTAGANHVVCQLQPAGHADRAPLPGTAGGTPGANQINITNLPATGSIDNDFPEVLGRISGTVFLDYFAGGPADFNNGVQNAGEPGIGSNVPGAGVTLTLTGTPSAGPGVGVPITPRTTTTLADGSYSFADLLPGSYTVTEGSIPLPLGTYNDGINTAGTVTVGAAGVAGAVGVNNISNIVLGASGASSSGNNFAELPRTTIWGLVFIDYDKNGVFNAIDTQRLPGVVIELRQGGTSCANATVLGTTSTAGDGSYVFPGGTVTPAQVVAGQNYRVCQQQPADFVNGPTLPGVNGTSALPNEILITKLPLTGSGSNHFGEWAVLTPAPTGPVISGTVFVDRNRDGNLTPVDETRIGGVTVRLVDGVSCSGPEVARTSTSSDGRYVFSGGLIAGRAYSLCEVQPADHADGAVRPGPGNSSPAANHIVIGSLSAPGSADNDFGEWGGRIAGRVYLDRDDNGLVGGSDTGIPGVVVTLTRDGQSFTRSALTQPDGSFAFEDLPGGRWTLTEQATQPSVTIDSFTQVTSNGRTTPGTGGGVATPVATTPSAIAGLTLPVGGEALNNLFGETVAASLAGRVWLDDDADGVIDAGEVGIAGVTIVLIGTDDQGKAVNLTQVTGADGRYEFLNLRPGTYTVTEPTQPGSTRNSATVPGSTGGTGTPNDVLPSVISGIPLATGQRSAENNFGETNAVPGLLVSKAAREGRFVAGRPGHYAITVRNGGSGRTEGRYTVIDRLPAGLTLAALPAGNGWTCTGGVGASAFSCSSSAVLAGAATAPVIELAVVIAASTANASPVSNAVLVEGGGEPADRAPTTDERTRFDTNPATLPLCLQPAVHNACRSVTEVVLPAALSGSVWLETGSAPRVLDSGDRPLPGWVVELVDPATGRVIATQTTGPDGRYRLADLEPGVPYGVRFRDPSSGVVYAGPVNGVTGTPAAACNPSAVPSSCGAGRRETTLTVILAPGQELTQQSLPVDPSGVVYDSVARDPVAGAVVTFAPVGSCAAYDPATQIAGATLGGYTVSGTSIRMTTGSNGFYNFVLLPSAPAHCVFGLTVAPPAQWTFPSALIPAQPGTLVPGGAAGSVVAVQPQPAPPTGDVGPATTYYVQLDVGSATPDVVHNHIPVDAALPAGVRLSKTGDKAVVEIGDSVRYRITVSVTPGASPRQVTVVDRLPAGFTYIAGTAMVDGKRIADPAGAPGPQLAFQLGAVQAGGSVSLQYRVRVGVGAQQGAGINTAIAHACQTPASCVSTGTLTALPRSVPSNDDRYRVRVAGGAFGIEACVVGKVYVDCNGNHVQDKEELGIPGVRLVLQDGTFLTSDSEGKYSMCGLPPRSHVLRIDELTLPRGSRLTTSSNRNLGDAGSLWLDLKLGELQRADFIEGSCSNTVLDQVKARRAQGEVSAQQVEKAGRPALRFDSKAQGLNPLTSPRQGTDSANQQAPKERPAAGNGGAATDERYLPTPALPMNRPPPPGRRSSDAPDAAPSSAGEGT